MTVTKVRLLWMGNNFQHVTSDLGLGLDWTVKVISVVILLCVCVCLRRSEDEFLSSAGVVG